MANLTRYREIPDEEKIRLAREVYRDKPIFRVLMIVTICLSSAISPRIAAPIVSEDEHYFGYLAVISIAAAAVAGLQFALIAGLVRREVVKKKNAATRETGP